MLSSRRRQAGLAALASACWLCGSSASADDPPPLTSAAAVRALAPAEAERARPLLLRGVVTALSGWKGSFFLQDASAGISVDREDVVPEVAAGDEVEISGRSAPGLFAPVVVARKVRILGRSPLPAAVSPGYDAMVGGRWDSRWIEVAGVVRSAEAIESWGRRIFVLVIDLGGGTISARVQRFAGTEAAAALVDAGVRVRGVCATNFNDRRQFVGLRLFVNELADVQIEQPAPADPFAQAALHPDEVLRFRGDAASRHRVKVEGAITHHDPGRSLYVQDGEKGLLVESSQEGEAPVGARVQVVGFAAPGSYAPVLQNASFRILARGSPPPPLPVSATGIIVTTAEGFAAAPHDARLVTVRARVVERVQTPDDDSLILRGGDRLFRAQWTAPGADAPGVTGAPEAEVGSIVDATGVVAVRADPSREPRSFSLRLRSAADVVVVAPPPWWNSQRARDALIAAIVAALAAVGWVLLLRRQRRELQRLVARRTSELEATVADLTTARVVAEEANEAKSRFLSNMSHEIRTPLNAIVGAAALLRDGALPREQRHLVSIVRSGGEALLAIVDDVLDFSRIEAGRLELELGELDPLDCVEDALAIVAVPAFEKGLFLGSVPTADVPHRVTGDAARLRQILLNLVSNAVKFTSTGGVLVRTSARELGEGWELSFAVEDTGAGVPLERQAEIFDAFAQADSTIRRRFGGTGLGLAISRSLAERMHGLIRVASTPGRGSTFTAILRCSRAAPGAAAAPLPPQTVLVAAGQAPIELSIAAQVRRAGHVVAASGSLPALRARAGPRADVLVAHAADPDEERAAAGATDLAHRVLLVVRPTEGAAGLPGRRDGVTRLGSPVRRSDLARALAPGAGGAPARPPAPAAGPRALRVLVADDHAVNRMVAVTMLKRLGHVADEASDGVEAVAAVSLRHYDLVLLDVQMPEMDGLEAARRIVADHPGARPRLVAVTASVTREDRERCLASGMDEYVSKPMRLETLERLVALSVPDAGLGAPRAEGGTGPAA